MLAFLHRCAARAAACLLLGVSPPAAATFSILACDRDGRCGAAVATDNLAVGASVIYAQARVGALATQFETNPDYGPKGLRLLASGQAPEAVIGALLAGDGGFDGTGVEERQVGLVDAAGRTATYTGAVAQRSAWAGADHGEGCSAQGNGLAGEAVVKAMCATLRATPGTLAQRLMAALEAGQAAGGQSIGRMSAALLVRTPEGAWQDVDLRVDGAAEPIRDLRRLLDQRDAHEAMLRAERLARKGARAEAGEAIAQALRLSHGWDRIWRRAARLAMSLGDRQRALDCLGVFVAANPVWARAEMQDELYRPLRDSAVFRSWNR